MVFAFWHFNMSLLPNMKSLIQLTAFATQRIVGLARCCSVRDYIRELFIDALEL